MRLEYIIKKNKSTSKHKELIRDLETYIKCQNQQHVMEAIDSIINIDVDELIYRIGVWEDQLGSCKSNEEHTLIEKKINLTKAIINNIL